MRSVGLQARMVVATVAMFLAALWINDELFRRLEFVPGINWVYLPAGVRLLATLLFGEAGAVGLLIVSWLVGGLYFFPGDFPRAFAGGIAATVAPYAVYKMAQRFMGLQASLSNLTTRRLMVCALACAVASPLMHHLWFFLSGERGDLLRGFMVMFVGDLTGTFIVLYTGKALIGLAQVLAARRTSAHF